MAAKKPNILILWGDDVGWWNISYNSRGQMGYRTPNIDRVANEGVAFTDYYAQQSCTAGRAAFITGQNPIRTGLTKVGMPGADVGMPAEDPTIAELLKPLGYATGQFGKNHLGDKDKFLPTMHGFDEFFGNLYHLNAEEEPEDVDYPKDPAFRKKLRPARRAPLLGRRQGRTEDRGHGSRSPRSAWRPSMKRRPSTRSSFIDKAHKEGKPFFVWYNTTAMHFRTHCAKKHEGKSGQGFYNDVMVAHDENIGKMLDKLDELGIADDTIVMYSTDNGPHYNTWPDGGITPFRAEKNTNWEGGWRVPAFVRWPGKIKPGSVLNGIVSHQDWLPTLLAAAGEPDIKEKLLDGYKVGDKTFKVHIDGFNMLPYLTGEVKESPRKFFFYISDDGDIMAIRMRRLEGRADGAAGEDDAMLVRAVRAPAGPQDLQLAPRPVRTGGRELEYLLGLGDLPCLHHLWDAGVGGARDRGVREVPAAAEAGLVQSGRGATKAAGRGRWREPLTRAVRRQKHGRCGRRARRPPCGGGRGGVGEEAGESRW